MQRIFVIFALVASMALFSAGCGSMKSMLSDPAWSENYALKGECTVEQMIDGSMYTAGETRPAEYKKGEEVDDSRFSEVTLTLKEPKDIRKIVLRRRSEDSVPVDLDILVMEDGDWKTLKTLRGQVGVDSERGNDIDIRVKVVTDQIKIRAQRATRTAKGKIAISTRDSSGRRTAQIDRILRQPIKIAEFEVYGLMLGEGT